MNVPLDYRKIFLLAYSLPSIVKKMADGTLRL